MKLIVGLGNPGKEYEKTRHNAGFLCLDLLQKTLGFPPFQLQKKFTAFMSEGDFGGEKLILVKPQTFMNRSGEAVTKLVQFYHTVPENLWLAYDDIDLPLGEIRIRTEGSAGSHNGMKSVITSLGFKNFPRVRIGIESRGASAAKEQDLSSFVLHAFLKKELPIAKKALEQSIKALLIALKEGIQKAQEAYN